MYEVRALLRRQREAEKVAVVRRTRARGYDLSRDWRCLGGIILIKPIKTIHTPSEASVPSTAPECRDCRVAMDAGLMLDRTHGGSEEPMWIKGTADKGIFGMIKERDRERLPVVTFRCPKCGRLESFAQTV